MIHKNIKNQLIYLNRFLKKSKSKKLKDNFKLQLKDK